MSANAWSNGPDGRRSAQNQSPAPQNDPEDYLNKLFQDAVGNNVEALTFKSSSTATNTKGGAWTNKNATMGNGKDFFAELRKQMISLTEKEKAGG